MLRDREMARTLRYALSALLVMALYCGAQAAHLGDAADWVLVGLVAGLGLAAWRECRRADAPVEPPPYEGVTDEGYDMPDVDRTEVFVIPVPGRYRLSGTVPLFARGRPACPECGDDHEDDDRHPGPVELAAREAVDAAPFRDLLDQWDRDIRSMRERWRSLDLVATAS